MKLDIRPEVDICSGGEELFKLIFEDFEIFDFFLVELKDFILKFRTKYSTNIEVEKIKIEGKNAKNIIMKKYVGNLKSGLKW